MSKQKEVLVLPIENLRFCLEKLFREGLKDEVDSVNKSDLNNFYSDEVKRFKKEFKNNRQGDTFELSENELQAFYEQMLKNFIAGVLQDMALSGEIEMGIDSNGEVTDWKKK